ncbi:MAG: phosphoglycerate mutase family protein [Ruminococcaceae bacterium]|nr:phosphoglycerate mutase family protein [Oscillospiraceae bacterium]
MKTYKIYLIRHGATDGNARGEYIGVTDLPLSLSGATNLANLKDKIEYPQVEKVYTSPMLRCRQTANILYPEFSAENIDNLTEYDFGEFEGKNALQLESNPDFYKWTSGQISSPPGGEDSTEFAKRVCLGFHEVVEDMMANGITRAAIIMHGGAIMTLLSCCAVPRRRSLEWTSENGRGYGVLVTPSFYHSNGIIEVTEEI